ncbi:hypothetical protein HYV56_01065 [Candidatus Peregrinibacteria bacterium]|nr:hypothetical protein [Candidatus Peregrinibacteria bacterium]
MKNLKNIIGAISLIIVAWYYFKYHSYYTGYLVHSKYLIIFLIAWSTIMGGIFALQKLRKKNTLTISPLRAILLAIFAVWFTGMMVYVELDPAVYNSPLRIIKYEGKNQWAAIEKNVEIPENAELMFKDGVVLTQKSRLLGIFPQEIRKLFLETTTINFAKTYFLRMVKVVGIWLLLLILFHNIGSFFQRKREQTLYEFFEAIAFGMAVVMLGMFVLGYAEMLNEKTTWAMFVILFLISLPKIKSLIKALLKYKKEFTLKEAIKGILPLSIILIILSFNFINSLSFFPNGHDSLSLYQNTPNLLVQYGSLMSGVPAYNFELINTLVLLLFKSKLISMSLNFFVGFLALWFMYETFKKFIPWKDAMLLIAIFVSLPMTSFIVSVDPKIDMPLLFFSLLAIHSALNKKYARTGLLLGIAFGMKYTSLLLIATIFAFFAYETGGILATIGITLLTLAVFGLKRTLIPIELYSREIQLIIINILALSGFISIFYTLIRRKIPLKDLKPFFITGAIIVLTFSPWLLKNGLETKTLGNSLLYGKNVTPNIDRKTIEAENKICTPIIDKKEVDLGSYRVNDKGISVLVKIPIATTINPIRPNDRISDISFLFLGFLPFVILGWKEGQKEEKDEEKKKWKKITIFTIVYFFLWLTSTNGIIWYGMPLFIGLLLMYHKVWKTEKWPYIVVVIWFAFSLLHHFSDTFTDNATLLYAGGLTNEEVLFSQRFRGSAEMQKILNSKENMNKNVYLIGQFLDYFIEKNDRRVYKDSAMEDFTCLFRDDNPEMVKKRLKNAGFTFIAYSEKGLYPEKDLNGPLHKQFRWFKEFADNYLIKEVEGEEMTLYSVPD